MYWYYPHVHKSVAKGVQGGASGVIIVEGIQNLQPEVIGLSEQIFVFRENPINPTYSVGYSNVPSFDLSLNFIPISYPDYTPVQMTSQPKQKLFWRILNSCSASVLNLTLVYDGVLQVCVCVRVFFCLCVCVLQLYIYFFPLRIQFFSIFIYTTILLTFYSIAYSANEDYLSRWRSSRSWNGCEIPIGFVSFSSSW